MSSSKVLLRLILSSLLMWPLISLGQDQSSGGNAENVKVRIGRDGSQLHEPQTTLTPEDTIKGFTRNLTDMAAKGLLPEYVGGREHIFRIIESLEKRTNKAVMIVAPPGAGKSALVEAVAKQLYELGKTNPTLAKFRIYDFNANSLKADTESQGELEKRIKGIHEFFTNDPYAVLFIDEIHILFKDDSPLTQALKQPLARGEMLSIAATTVEEYKEYVQNDAAFKERYNFLFLPEITKDKVLTILRKLKLGFQKFHSERAGINIHITDQALQEIPKQVESNFHEDSLARKSIDIMDRMMVRERLQLTMGTLDAAMIENQIEALEIEKSSLDSDMESNPSSDLAHRILEIEVEKSVLESMLEEEKNKNTVHFRQGNIERMSKQLAELKTQNPNEKTPEMLKIETEIRFSQNELANAQVSEKKTGEIGRIDVLNFIEAETGTDRAILNESIDDRMKRLENNLKYALVGQDQISNTIKDLFVHSSADVEEKSGPGNLLLVDGTEGNSLEKTIVAQTISDVTRGEGKPPLVINFGKLNAQTGTNALLGSDYGYVDSNKGGKLDHIRRNQKLVLVLQGINKMDPELWKIIEPIIVDGFTTDSRNIKLDFRNATVILDATWAHEYAASEKNRLSDADLEKKYEFPKGFLAGKTQKIKDQLIIEKIMIRDNVPPHIARTLSRRSVVLTPVGFESSVIMAERQMSKQKRYLESRYLTNVDIQKNAVADFVARLAFDGAATSHSITEARRQSFSQLLADAKIAFPVAFESTKIDPKTVSITFEMEKNKKGGTLFVKQNGQVLAQERYILNNPLAKPKQIARKPLKANNLTGKATELGEAGKKIDPRSREALLKRATDAVKRKR